MMQHRAANHFKRLCGLRIADRRSVINAPNTRTNLIFPRGGAGRRERGGRGRLWVVGCGLWVVGCGASGSEIGDWRLEIED
jgi:hypothetical protein